MRPRRLVPLTVVILLVAAAASAQRVECVIDGDAIVVQGIGTVRLIGVNIPETVDPRRPVRYFGSPFRYLEECRVRARGSRGRARTMDRPTGDESPPGCHTYMRINGAFRGVSLEVIQSWHVSHDKISETSLSSFH
jgi:hypothetical protein